MRYLGLALYAEGPTDYAFLLPLLQRLCEEVCVRTAIEPVEVSEVQGLNHPVADNDASREQRVLAAARQAKGSWNVLFVHADGANDPQRMRRNLVEPSLALLSDELNGEGIGVAVVPVREMEAWALVDGDAIRASFGTVLSDEQLGLPTPGQADKEIDPKNCLKQVFEASGPRGQRQRRGVRPYLGMLGQTVSMEALRGLQAFRELETDLRAALKQLRILT